MLVEAFLCAAGGVLVGFAVGRFTRERRLGQAWSEGYTTGVSHVGVVERQRDIVYYAPPPTPATMTASDYARVLAAGEERAMDLVSKRKLGLVEVVGDEPPQGFGPYGES